MKSPAFMFLRLFPLIVILVTLTGCSSFHGDWKAAQAMPISKTSMEGPWDGEWKSDENGHHGRLRCLISQSTNELWQARFHATYKTLKFIPITFGYTVQLSVQEEEGEKGQFVFHGEEDLGKLAGGLYTYEGKASADQFFSTYRCQYDHGTFRMSRPD